MLDISEIRNRVRVARDAIKQAQLYTKVLRDGFEDFPTVKVANHDRGKTAWTVTDWASQYLKDAEDRLTAVSKALEGQR